MNFSSRKRHREMHSNDFFNVHFELLRKLRKDSPETTFHKVGIVIGGGSTFIFILFTTVTTFATSLFSCLQSGFDSDHGKIERHARKVA